MVVLKKTLFICLFLALQACGINGDGVLCEPGFCRVSTVISGLTRSPQAENSFYVRFSFVFNTVIVAIR